MKMSEKRKGFTLVELIVVIGLIAFIAAAFIFPALERVRGRVYDVVCISNLRQIGTALLMYAQNYDELIPPYCNIPASKTKRWRSAFDPYVRDKGIFFCPNDPFAGLTQDKIPSQGLPVPYLWHVSGLNVTITSYASCMGIRVRGEAITIEEMFAKGYHLTTNLHRNIASFPRDWLFAPPEKDFPLPFHWLFPVINLHFGASVYLFDDIHFAVEKSRIELFCDGSVDLHHVTRHCFLWRELESYFKKLGGEQQ